MTIENLIRFLLQSYLNPLLFVVYLFGFRKLFNTFGITISTYVGTNNERLSIAWYLVLMPGIYLIWFSVNFMFLKSFNEHLTIDSFLSLDIHWLQYLGFVFTGLTLKAYSSSSGMEGNIMGFIFFPILLSGIAINGFYYFYWIWSVVLAGAGS
jgi:hypothetical protein